MSRYHDHYYASSSGITSVDAAGGQRDIDADLKRVATRRVVLDTSHMDMSSSNANDCHFDVRVQTMKNVSGIRVVDAVVPRFVGTMKQAVLTATVGSTAHKLYAFAPETATLSQLGDIFRSHLEEDAKQAATTNFSSPWFQSLTIKTTIAGFVVVEYYNTASSDVSDVTLDLTQFEALKSRTKLEYASDGFVQAGGESTPSTNNKGFWLFSQQVLTVHPTYGCPYLCLNDVENAVDTPEAGNGSMLQHPVISVSASGGIASVSITDGGSGYTIGDAVSFTGTGTGAAAQVTGVGVNGEITAISMTTFGSGYTAGTTVVFSGSGGGASGSVNLSTPARASVEIAEGVIRSIAVDSAGTGYAVGNSITITGSGSGASAVVGAVDSTEITRIDIRNGGSGYAQHDTLVDCTATGDGNATATAIVSRRGVRHVTVTASGSAYDTAPSVSLSGVHSSLSLVASNLQSNGQQLNGQQSHDDMIRRASLSAKIANGEVTHIDITDAGEGYPLKSHLKLPHNILAVLTENHDTAKPLQCNKPMTKWFKTPLSSLSRLRVSIRTPYGDLYPLHAGRAVICLEIYCDNE